MKISDLGKDMIQPSRRPRYNRPPRIDKKSILAIGDSQIPFHDHEWINKCKKLAFAYGIRTSLWAGDIVDFTSLSIFVAKNQEVEKELIECEEHLGELAAGFTDIIYLPGNHELRLQRLLREWVSMDRVCKLLNLPKQVRGFDYSFCEVGGDWLVEHPKNYSVIAGRVAATLAEKYRKNIAIFHDHQCGEMKTRDGRFIGMSVGMCADGSRLDYYSVAHSTTPKMMQGALLLRWDGQQYFPHHLTEETDWDYEFFCARKKGKK